MYLNEKWFTSNLVKRLKEIIQVTYRYWSSASLYHNIAGGSSMQLTEIIVSVNLHLSHLQ